MESGNVRVRALVENPFSSWFELKKPLFMGAKEELVLSNGVSSL